MIKYQIFNQSLQVSFSSHELKNICTCVLQWV